LFGRILSRRSARQQEPSGILWMAHGKDGKQSIWHRFCENELYRLKIYMKAKRRQKNNLPVTSMPFKPSRTLLGILAATILLAVLTAFSTYNNISHEQDRMEQFLFQKGETLINAIEAGGRTYMMHHMGTGSLHTLLNESIQENSIAFIRIINQQAEVVDEAGTVPAGINLTQKEVQNLLSTQQPVARFDLQSHIYIISRTFRSNSHGYHSAMPRMMSGIPVQMMGEDAAPQIISIGLVTDAIDNARQEDVHHALIMGGILFLIGSAGIYFLFLYQESRVARTNLADLKIYTDNVIESMPAGLITLDTEGKILSCNHMSEKIFGKSRDQLQEMEIKGLLAKSTFYSFDNQTQVADQSGEIRRDDGSSLPIQLSVSSLLNTENKVIGTVLIIRDMSLFRDLELQLERSRRMVALGKMAAGIAHEIRNPLGTLRGFAQYFCKKHGCSVEDQDYANLMVSEVDRLNRTVSGLLQFARPRDPQPVVCKLDELLEKTEILMKADFSSHNIRFIRQEPTGISLTCDPDLILQVLMNLLQNSINATSSDGVIRLSASQNEQDIRISVADNGCGMNEHDREKMFDPFFTTSKKGTGLGLAVSHQIIEQHNGSFEVETAVDHGTTLTIVLPKTEGGMYE